jgi:signal transduction histidine kinase
MRWFKNLRLAPKLVTGFAAVLALSAATGAFAIGRLAVVNEQSTVIADSWLPSVEKLGTINTLVSAIRATQYRHVASIDSSQMAAAEQMIGERVARLETAERAYVPLITSPRERALYDGFRTAWTAYLAEWQRIQPVSRAGRTDEASAMMRGEAFHLYAASSARLDSLVALNHDGAAAANRLGDEIYASARTAILAALAASLLLGLGIAVAIARMVSTPVRRMAEVAGALAEGDVEQRLEIDTRDEVGDLARAFARMQTSLRRQEEARRAFVSTASHELRTPLTMLQGTLELLEEDLRDGRLDRRDALEQVAGAQHELRRLARLATELLDLSRLDADLPLRREPVELGELARAVAAEFALAAADRDVTLEVIPPPGPCWAGGDPGAVARVVRILLENALRYAPPRLPVRVTAAYHGETATVEVADRGPGVPAGDRERIFRRFERGTQTDAAGGFGLGLAIGRELAQRMGGELRLIEDGRPGVTFRLALPIELPAGSHAGEPVATA